MIITPRKPGAGLRFVSPDTKPAQPQEEPTSEGFAPPPRRFDLGVVDGRRLSRAEMPLLVPSCGMHSALIDAEQRDDSAVLVTAIRMQDDGTLRFRAVDDPPRSPEQRAVITEGAFSALVAKTQLPASGRYLRQCWPELRSINVNAWIERLERTERKALAAAALAERAATYVPLDVRLRHRVVAHDDTRNELAKSWENPREIYAAVGTSYADVDANVIDEVIGHVFGANGAAHHARITYDGVRTRWEIWVREDVKVFGDQFVDVGVVLVTDDTGSGAMNGQLAVRDNASKNILFVSTSATAAFSLRHIGDSDVLATKLAGNIDRVIGAFDTFDAAWSFAHQTEPLLVAGAMYEGVVRDLFVRDIIPRPTRTLDDAVREVSDLLFESAGLVACRAALAMGFAHWAQTLGLDPWREDEIQHGAGMLMRRTKKNDGWAIKLNRLAREDLK